MTTLSNNTPKAPAARIVALMVMGLCFLAVSLMYLLRDPQELGMF